MYKVGCFNYFLHKAENVSKNNPKHENKEGFEGLLNLLGESKIFKIPENINFMLLNTKNRITKTKLPYLYIFLDTKIIIYDRTYYGIILGDIDQLRDLSIKENLKKQLINEEGIIITTFYESSKETQWTKFNLYDKKVNKYVRKLQEYIANAISFLNSEDIRISVHERTNKNRERRIRENKVPIPSYNKIEIVGYLRKYLDKVESQGIGNKLTHRFWVRGHFRHFWNAKYDVLYKKYKNGELRGIEGKQYLMDNSGALKLWIYPYIKGDGILIEKQYELK